MLKVFSAMLHKFSKILAVSRVTQCSFRTDDSQFRSDVQTSLLPDTLNSVYVKWYKFVYEREKNPTIMLKK
jgi:hypothetical protein